MYEVKSKITWAMYTLTVFATLFLCSCGSDKNTEKGGPISQPVIEPTPTPDPGKPSPTPTPPPAIPFTDSFARANASDLGKNWYNETGAFGIYDYSAMLTTPGQNGLAIASVLGRSAKDLSLSIDVMNLPVNGCVGLIARHNPVRDKDYYEAKMCQYNGSAVVGLAKNLGGQLIYIASASVSSGVGTLRFTLMGSTLMVFRNGVKLIQKLDSTFIGAGRFGIKANMIDTKVRNFDATAP